MTQHALILAYIEEFGSVTPAKMYGEVYKGQMCGSEFSRRCRELRKRGILESKREGKFEIFYRKNEAKSFTKEIKEQNSNLETQSVDSVQPLGAQQGRMDLYHVREM
jgi:hypothetical protein